MTKRYFEFPICKFCNQENRLSNNNRYCCDTCHIEYGQEKYEMYYYDTENHRYVIECNIEDDLDFLVFEDKRDVGEKWLESFDEIFSININMNITPSNIKDFIDNKLPKLTVFR